MLVLTVLIKSLAPINKGLMNGDFLVKDLLVCFVNDGITGNPIFHIFQSVYGLYLFSQESPRITKIEGILIMLNTTESVWLPNFTSREAIL